MNSESKEHLSSLMDGELSVDSGRFLVRRLAADESLRASWSRYHVIRDCLRSQPDGFLRIDLSQRVAAALAAEPAPRTRAWSSAAVVRPMAGLAVAASVAFLAIMTVSRGPQTGAVEPGNPALAATAGPAASASEPFTSPSIGSLIPASQPVNLSGEIRPDNPKMNAYLLRHYQAAGESGKGFVSFVPIVVTRAGTAVPTKGKSVDPDSRP